MSDKHIRGFDLLVGKKIVDIDSSCINIVRFTLEGGQVIEIDCDKQHYGIGVLRCQAAPD
jgi:hypothetical protein